MINPKTLDSNREFLESNVVRLEKSLESHSRAGLTTEADKEFERGDAYNPKQVERWNHKATNDLLGGTRVALKRMDEGTYGICVDCGEEINEDRLIARPEASRCIKCQKERGLQVR